MAREEVALIAEDDGMYLNTLTNRFRDEGLAVIPASNAGELVEIAGKERGRISFLLVDAWLLPAGDFKGQKPDDNLGWAVAAVREIRARYPELRIFGFSNEAPAEVASWFEDYTCGFFSKDAFRRNRVGETLDIMREVTRAPRKSMAVGQNPAKLVSNANADLWMRGLFFLLALVVIAVVVGALAKLVPWWALGPVLVGCVVLYVIVAGFVVGKQELGQKGLLTLVQAGLRQLPLVGRLLPKGVEVEGSGKKALRQSKAAEELQRR